MICSEKWPTVRALRVPLCYPLEFLSVAGARLESTPSRPQLPFVPATVQPVAAREFAAICDEVDAIAAVQSIASALSTGGVVGTVGNLDTTNVSSDGLTAVISKWEPSARRTAVLQRVITTAKAVRDVRVAILKGDWEFVAASLDFEGDTAVAAGMFPVFLLLYRVVSFACVCLWQGSGSVGQSLRFAHLLQPLKVSSQ